MPYVQLGVAGVQLGISGVQLGDAEVQLGAAEAQLGVAEVQLDIHGVQLSVHNPALSRRLSANRRRFRGEGWPRRDTRLLVRDADVLFIVKTDSVILVNESVICVQADYGFLRNFAA